METVAEVVPFEAWVQAVFVCLFIVLVIILINWFTRQSERWQAFIEASNDKWRKFSQEQREANNCAIADVNAGLTNLTKVTEGLVMEVREMREESHRVLSELQDHDVQAKEILMKVSKPPRAPRANGNQTNSDKEQ